MEVRREWWTALNRPWADGGGWSVDDGWGCSLF